MNEETATPPAERLAACGRCGHEIEPDDDFCSWCGAALDEVGKKEAIGPRVGPIASEGRRTPPPQRLRRLLTRAAVAWVVALLALGAVAGLWQVSAADQRSGERELRETVTSLRRALAERDSREVALRERLGATSAKIRSLQDKLGKARQENGRLSDAYNELLDDYNALVASAGASDSGSSDGADSGPSGDDCRDVSCTGD